MNRIRLQVIWFVLSLSVALPAHAAEEDFVALFDGKTLEGWTINYLPRDKNLAAKAWTVDGGTILADSTGHTEHFYILLATKATVGTTWRLPPKGRESSPYSTASPWSTTTAPAYWTTTSIRNTTSA
jgi:hypothetical protein